MARFRPGISFWGSANESKKRCESSEARVTTGASSDLGKKVAVLARVAAEIVGEVLAENSPSQSHHTNCNPHLRRRPRQEGKHLGNHTCPSARKLYLLASTAKYWCRDCGIPRGARLYLQELGSTRNEVRPSRRRCKSCGDVAR